MNSVRPWIPTLVVAAAVGALVFMPSGASGVGILTVALVGPLAIVLGRLPGNRPDRDVLVTLGLASAVPLLLFVSALASVNQYVGIAGRFQQHNGAALWLSFLGLAASMAMRSLPGDLERLVRTIAVAAAVLGVSVLFDAAGLDFGRKFSPEPSGLLVSSQTAGQVLVLGLAAGVAWTLLTRRWGTDRLLAIAAASLCAVALLSTDARAAIGAVVISACGMAALGRRASRSPVSPRSFGIVAVSVVTLVTGVTAGLAVLGSRASWWATLNQSLSDRLVLWRAAAISSARAPLLGRGPDQFQAVLSWDAAAGDVPAMTVAADAHNLLMTMAATGGLIVAGAFLVALGAAAGALGASLVRARFATPALVLAGGLTAWFISLQFAWVGEFGGLLASLLFGALVGAGRGRPSTRGGSAGALAVAGVWFLVLVALSVFIGPGLAAEVRWGLPGSPQDLYGSALIALDSPDPVFAEELVESTAVKATQLGDDRAPEALRPLVTKIEPDVAWSATTARVMIDYEMLTATVGDGSTGGVTAAVTEARRADSLTGVWDYLGAVYAMRLGDRVAAERHARAALEYPVGPLAEAWLRSVAGP